MHPVLHTSMWIPNLLQLKLNQGSRPSKRSPLKMEYSEALNLFADETNKNKIFSIGQISDHRQTNGAAVSTKEDSTAASSRTTSGFSDPGNRARTSWKVEKNYGIRPTALIRPPIMNPQYLTENGALAKWLDNNVFHYLPFTDFRLQESPNEKSYKLKNRTQSDPDSPPQAQGNVVKLR